MAITKRKKKLTPRQLNFALLMATGELSAVECAKRVGVPEGGRATTASRWNIDERIQAEIERQREIACRVAGVSPSWVISEAIKLYQRTETDQPKVALDCLKQLGQWLAMAGPGREVRHVLAFEDLLARADPVVISQEKPTTELIGSA